MLSIFTLAAACLSAPLAQSDGLPVAEHTLKPAPIKAKQASYARSLTIEIEVASASPLVLDYAELTSGNWQQVPMQGSTIEPGDAMTYLAGTENTYKSLGGTVTLSLPSGASFPVEFEWTPGSQAMCSVADANLQTVTVHAELLNTMGNSPTCLVTVTDANNG